MSSYPAKSRLTPPSSGARLATHIYDQLKLQLLDGVYAPGEKLVVDSLRTDFNVSKQPVMDALRNLASDGLVEIIPQVGCAVRSYPRSEIEDFYLFVAAAEEIITQLAAVRRTPELLRALRISAARMSQLPVESAPGELAARYRQANREFHGIIHQMANSEIVTGLSRRVWDLTDFFVHALGASSAFGDSFAERHHDHEEILIALEEGDAEKAGKLAREHILHTGRLILQSSAT
jgi:DNA-binding GntR family transcriptional regulator